MGRNGCSVEPLVTLLISLNKTVQLGSNKTHWGGGEGFQSLTTLKGCIDPLTCRACGIDFRGSEHGLKYAEGVSPIPVFSSLFSRP